MRIGDPIKRQKQRGLAQLGTAIDQGVEVKGVGCSGLQRDPLVHRTPRDLAQPRPGDLLHQHARSLGLAQQLQKLGGAAHLRRTPDPVNRPT